MRRAVVAAVVLCAPGMASAADLTDVQAAFVACRTHDALARTMVLSCPETFGMTAPVGLWNSTSCDMPDGLTAGGPFDLTDAGTEVFARIDAFNAKVQSRLDWDASRQPMDEAVRSRVCAMMQSERNAATETGRAVDRLSSDLLQG